jgi:predicted nucleic acid-binding protein
VENSIESAPVEGTNKARAINRFICIDKIALSIKRLIFKKISSDKTMNAYSNLKLPIQDSAMKQACKSLMTI